MTTTLIAKRTRVGGRIETEGDVVVDGRVEGSLVAGGTITVGNTGVAVCDIQAERVAVLGIVIGNILATGRVNVASSARIVGDVRAPVVSVAPPAIIEGRIEQAGTPAPAPLPPAPEAPPATTGGSTRPTLKIRGAPLVRPARPEGGAPEPSDSQRVAPLRPPPAADAGASSRPPVPPRPPATTADSGPRLRARNPGIVPLPPRPPSRVGMVSRRAPDQGD